MDRSFKRLKLLIIEDNQSYQELYKEILGDKYDIDIAGNKEEALAKVKAQAPDIALVDMRLVFNERGNQDGLDVAQSIRDLGYNTAIILKSGFPTETPEIAKRIESLKVYKVLDKNAQNAVQELVESVNSAAARIK